MAINYGANYTGIDKDRYDAGNKFYSQDPYLQGTGLNKPAITFNPSQSNTGIMSGYNPYPIIPQYSGDGDGGGGGGGPKGPGGRTDVGEGFGGGYGNLSSNAFDEEKDLFGGVNFKNAKNLGLFALNPFGFLLNKVARYGINKYKDYREDKRNDQGGYYGDDDYSGGLKGNVTQKGPGRQDREGGDGGGSQNDDQSSSGGGYDGGQASSKGDENMAYGGRAGYRDGGLTEYEVFKLGELGYNTKGGTVLKPFGGINVLRDILKVNKYAYGGIVGMYR